MKLLKMVLALALFTTSVSYSDQVLDSKNGLVYNWEIQIGVSSSHAMYALEQFE